MRGISGSSVRLWLTATAGIAVGLAGIRVIGWHGPILKMPGVSRKMQLSLDAEAAAHTLGCEHEPDVLIFDHLTIPDAWPSQYMPHLHFSSLTFRGSVIPLEALSYLSPSVRYVTLDRSNVVDEHLSRCPSGLLGLSLRDTKITDKGIFGMSQVVQLEELSLAGTKITDRVVSRLRGCIKLRKLDLSSTDISNACLEDLASITTLDAVNVSKTRVTRDAVRESPLSRSQTVVSLD